jgi:hypothetical protein
MSRLTKAWRNSRFYRCWTARRLPHFLIVGAQKAGTTALVAYLAQHPRLALAAEKEVDFFASDLRYGQGLPWYGSQWDRKLPRDTLRFEASPNYLFMPKAAGRIQRHVSSVKLIAVLRDPVLRAYSSWQMYRSQLADDPEFYRNYYQTRFTPAEVAALAPRTAAELDDFALAVEREVRLRERGERMQMSVLEPGFYAEQLNRYFQAFRREQLLVLDSNDLRTRRVKTLNRVLRFLGLPPWNWSNTDLADVFVGRWTAPMPPRTRDFLHDYYRESNSLLAQMLDLPPLFAREDSRQRASA